MWFDRSSLVSVALQNAITRPKSDQTDRGRGPRALSKTRRKPSRLPSRLVTKMGLYYTMRDYCQNVTPPSSLSALSKGRRYLSERAHRLERLARETTESCDLKVWHKVVRTWKKHTPARGRRGVRAVHAGDLPPLRRGRGRPRVRPILSRVSGADGIWNSLGRPTWVSA